MGLPAFIAPPSPTAPAAAEKTASESRSSIRRQRPLGRPRPHARSSVESHRRRMIEMGVLDSNPRDYEVWESQRRSPPDEPQPSSFAAPVHGGSHLYTGRTRDSYERRYPAEIEVDGPLMPPVPESRDYNAYSEYQRTGMAVREIRRMARRRPAPTPPSRETDVEPVGRMGGDSPSPLYMTRAIRGRDRLRTLSYSEARDDEYPGPSVVDPEVNPRGFGFGPSSSYRFDRPSRPSLSERIHALSRAGDSNRQFRPAAVDGLGDRDRSLSPEGGAAWDTLLGSITPDPQPPSVGSSFASASVSAAASSNAGPNSASTSMTSLGMVEDSSALRDCDISDPSDSEPGIDEDEDQDDLDDLHAFNRATRGERFWRTYADVVTARADRVAQSTSGDTEHLGGMHRIISRLAERDDIPDEWWAGAGLRREPTA